MSLRIKIFCSYARKDQLFLAELKVHLRSLERQGLISMWTDTDISSGTQWEEEIDTHLNTAQIILLLISPDFMASDYCFSNEMKKALRRHERKEARVIPIILRPTNWQVEPLKKLQALPKDAEAITLWHNRDAAFLDVVQGINKAIEELTVSRYITQPLKNPSFVNEKLKKRKPRIYLTLLIVLIIILVAFSTFFSVRLLASHINLSHAKSRYLTPISSVATTGLTPTPISPSTFDAEFPANIVGPAIVEWADGGCGIFKLNMGERFNWSNDGHYWLYANQASLDAFYPGHLKDYQKKNPPSCVEGRPKQP